MENTDEDFQQNVDDNNAISGRFILISSGIPPISLRLSPRHLRPEFRFVNSFVTAWRSLWPRHLVVLFKGDIVGKLVLTNTFPTNPFDYPSNGCWRRRDYLWANKNLFFFFLPHRSKQKKRILGPLAWSSVDVYMIAYLGMNAWSSENQLWFTESWIDDAQEEQVVPNLLINDEV